MKNFQQTPKQRRLVMAGNKALFSQSRCGSFQPRDAWSTKQKVGGVPASVLDSKQYVLNQQYYQSDAFKRLSRHEERQRQRMLERLYGEVPYSH